MGEGKSRAGCGVKEVRGREGVGKGRKDRERCKRRRRVDKGEEMRRMD